MSRSRYPDQPLLVDGEEARALLVQGEPVIVPTETVYGLAADATNPEAVARIFAAKDRPRFNPLICHLDSAESLGRYATVNPPTSLLAFWPGPLTVLLPRNDRIPSIVTAGSDLCGFRVPAQPALRGLLARFGRPLAAPSANRSGLVSPTTVAMACEQLAGRVAAAIDGGPCSIGIESTVVLPLSNSSVRVLRPGAITVADLRDAGFEVVERDAATESPASFLAPGQQTRHYAPAAPLYFVGSESAGRDAAALDQLLDSVAEHAGGEPHLVWFGPPPEGAPPRLSLTNLSAEGDLAVAAARLFATLADAGARTDCLLAFAVPDEGLGTAINDRLLRAASFVAEPQGRAWLWRERSH